MLLTSVPLSQTVTPSRTPSSVMYFMDGALVDTGSFEFLIHQYTSAKCQRETKKPPGTFLLRVLSLQSLIASSLSRS